LKRPDVFFGLLFISYSYYYNILTLVYNKLRRVKLGFQLKYNFQQWIALLHIKDAQNLNLFSEEKYDNKWMQYFEL